MWRKWKERDAAKLRKLQREHNSLVVKTEKNTHKFNSEINELYFEIKALKKAVKAKEVTHVQRIEVDVSRNSSWEDFPY